MARDSEEARLFKKNSVMWEQLCSCDHKRPYMLAILIYFFQSEIIRGPKFVVSCVFPVGWERTIFMWHKHVWACVTVLLSFLFIATLFLLQSTESGVLLQCSSTIHAMLSAHCGS